MRTVLRNISMAAIAAAAVLTMGAGAAQAAEYDCTAGCTVTIDGAIFTTTDNQSTGTGVIQSFVRISAANKSIVDGHNTDGRPVANDENNSPQFTRDLELADVPIVNIGGTNYYEFLLDINQTNADPLLSLDEIEICQSNTGGLVQADACPTLPLVYNLDAGTDDWLKLDYSDNAGSGSGDLFMYVPTSFFGAGTYVYLYSLFGQNVANNDGFEEWAVRTPQGTNIPEPATLLLFGVAIAGGIRRATRRRVS